jgi:hypothetical protein
VKRVVDSSTRRKGYIESKGARDTSGDNVTMCEREVQWMYSVCAYSCERKSVLLQRQVKRVVDSGTRQGSGGIYRVCVCVRETPRERV